jgi:hypothetical protein
VNDVKHIGESRLAVLGRESNCMMTAMSEAPADVRCTQGTRKSADVRAVVDGMATESEHPLPQGIVDGFVARMRK